MSLCFYFVSQFFRKYIAFIIHFKRIKKKIQLGGKNKISGQIKFFSCRKDNNRVSSYCPKFLAITMLDK